MPDFFVRMLRSSKWPVRKQGAEIKAVNDAALAVVQSHVGTDYIAHLTSRQAQDPLILRQHNHLNAAIGVPARSSEI